MARRQSIAFMSRPSWSQSGHLTSLAATPMADAMVILTAISVAWTAETLMLAANTSPRIEVNVRRSEKRVMCHSMGIYFRTASPIPSRGCDLPTRVEAMLVFGTLMIVPAIAGVSAVASSIAFIGPRLPGAARWIDFLHLKQDVANDRCGGARAAHPVLHDHGAGVTRTGDRRVSAE